MAAHTANANPADGHDFETDSRAELGNQPRLRILQCKAQTVFALPADLGRRQFAALDGETAADPLKAMFDHLAGDLDHVFLLDLGGVFGQLAQYFPVLGKDQQAAGVGLQFGCPRNGRLPKLCSSQRLAALSNWRALSVSRPAGWFNSRVTGSVQLDLLAVDLELRFVDDLAVDRDPAALDEQLGLAARAADQLDKAFGKANGFRHDCGRNEKGGLLYLPGAARVRQHLL